MNAVIDYGAGNLRSVVNAFVEAIGSDFHGWWSRDILHGIDAV